MLHKQNGLTIIELMVVLLIAGIAGSIALRAIIEHRCEHDPVASICAKNSGPANKQLQ